MASYPGKSSYDPTSSRNNTQRDDRHQQQPAPHYKSTLRTSAVHNGFDIEDFHHAQEAHYFGKHRAQPASLYNTDPSLAYVEMGLHNYPTFAPSGSANTTGSTVSSPTQAKYTPDKYSAADRKATTRKPVASRDPKIGPQPPSHQHTVSADELGLPSPLTSHQEHVAAGAANYINTTPDGRFDPRTIHRGAPVQRPEMPTSTFATTPPTANGRPQGIPMPTTSFATQQQYSPPIRPSADRRDRSSSIGSITDSLKDLAGKVRRGSNEFIANVGRAAGLAAKGPVEREAYKQRKIHEKRASARQRSAEREAACQKDPEKRPPYENEALRTKNFHKFEDERGLGRSDSDKPNPFPANRSQHMKNAERQARTAERNSNHKQAERANRSGSPESFKSTNSLTPEERQLAREEQGIVEAPVKNPLNVLEKAGWATGELLDPLRRKPSDQSEFLSDPPPEGAMDKCSICNREPEHVLKQGKCEDCFEDTRGRRR